jgi:hypothetical protein
LNGNSAFLNTGFQKSRIVSKKAEYVVARPPKSRMFGRPSTNLQSTVDDWSTISDTFRRRSTKSTPKWDLCGRRSTKSDGLRRPSTKKIRLFWKPALVRFTLLEPSLETFFQYIFRFCSVLFFFVFVSGSFRLDLGRIEIKNWKLEFNVNIKLQISVNPKRHPEFNPRAEKLEARSLNREVFWSLKSFNCKQEHMQKRFNGV